MGTPSAINLALKNIMGFSRGAFDPSASRNYTPLKNVVFRNQTVGTTPPVFGYGAAVTNDIPGVYESKCIKIVTSPTNPGVTCGAHGFAGRFLLDETIPVGKTIWQRVKLFFPSEFSFGYAYSGSTPSSPASDGCAGLSADGNNSGTKFMVFAPDSGTARIYYNVSNSVRTTAQSLSTGVLAIESNPGGQQPAPYVFPRDEWFTLEMACKVAKDSSGYVRIWLNGILISESVDQRTIADVASGISEAGIGDYFNGTPWTDGMAGRDTFYIDEILVATDIDGFGSPDATDAAGNAMIGTIAQNRDFINGY